LRTATQHRSCRWAASSAGCVALGVGHRSSEDSYATRSCRWAATAASCVFCDWGWGCKVVIRTDTQHRRRRWAAASTTSWLVLL
jgi:hypothetical protein